LKIIILLVEKTQKQKSKIQIGKNDNIKNWKQPNKYMDDFNYKFP